MCNDPECRYITIIEDERTGEKCYIHYKINDDSTYTEILVEGEDNLRVFDEVLKDQIYDVENKYKKEELKPLIIRSGSGLIIITNEEVQLTEKDFINLDDTTWGLFIRSNEK
jgi:hypothetical protein